MLQLKDPMKVKKKRIIYVLLLIITLTLLALSGTIMSQVKEPKFQVIQGHNNIEVRDYSPVIAAQVWVDGERKVAISAGFKILANYIFGNNKPAKKISMTAPVIQQKGDKIAMTVPVIQQALDNDHWSIQFIMPSEYTLATLPQPNDSRINILSIPEKRYAVIRFSGIAGQENLDTHLAKLQQYLSEAKLRPIGRPLFAFYNPPWTLPFLRRNEIMIELEH